MNQIINQENGTDDLPIKRFCVSLVFTRPHKEEDGSETMEIRHQIMMSDGSSADAAEWLAEKLSKEDSQMPSDYQLNSVCSIEIEPFEEPKLILP